MEFREPNNPYWKRFEWNWVSAPFSTLFQKCFSILITLVSRRSHWKRASLFTSLALNGPRGAHYLRNLAIASSALESDAVWEEKSRVLKGNQRPIDGVALRVCTTHIFKERDPDTRVDKKCIRVFDKLFLSVSWWGAARYCCTIHLYIIYIPFLSVSRSAESYRFGLGLRQQPRHRQIPYRLCGGRSWYYYIYTCGFEMRRQEERKFTEYFLKSFVEKQIREIWKLNQAARVGRTPLAGCMHILSSLCVHRGWKKTHTARTVYI